MDERALQILFETYQMPDGTPRERKRRGKPEDFDYAKSAGVMFDPVKLSHQDVLDRLFAAIAQVDQRSVVDAFLASLSTRQLHLRAALYSYSRYRHLTHHKANWSGLTCNVCGQWRSGGSKTDLSLYNWGRLRHGCEPADPVVFAMFCLELFLKEEQPQPTPADIEIFNQLIAAIEAAPLETTAAKLPALWTKIVKGNHYERGTIVEILGFCGILETLEHPGFRQRFIPEDDQELPNRHYIDTEYPACWWRRSDGINREALEEWFGPVLAQA